MAKPRKRKKTIIDRLAEIPTVKGAGSARAKKGRLPPGAARDTHVLRQTRVQTPTGPRDTGNGDGKGSYGPNRLHGQAQSLAIALAKKASWPRTQEAMNEYLASGGEDTVRLLPFRPTNTIGPQIGRRRRTQAAGYDGRSKTVRILFSDGESNDSLNGPIYEYYGVPYSVWRMVKRNVSTGRTINRTLNNYSYAVLRQSG